MNSVLTLPYLTCIDHAYIDEVGRIKGRSYHASFKVAGSVTKEEKVVVDFSNIKKRIKAIVDDRIYGLDHKLWVDDAWVNRAHIETPLVELYIPVNAYHKFYSDEHLIKELSELYIGNLVEDMLKADGLAVEVSCTLNENPLFIEDRGVYGMFNYFHGLKDSSSWGCKNLAHGHTSYLQLLAFDDDLSVGPVNSMLSNRHSAEVCRIVCEDLRNTGFINVENVLTLNNETISLCYNAKDRGYMRASFREEAMQKLVVLETETTVEYLAEYVSAKYGELMKSAGVTHFILSEGLAKGVLFNLN